MEQKNTYSQPHMIQICFWTQYKNNDTYNSYIEYCKWSKELN